MNSFTRFLLCVLVISMCYACNNSNDNSVPKNDAQYSPYGGNEQTEYISYIFHGRNGCTTLEHKFYGATRSERLRKMCSVVLEGSINHFCAARKRTDFFNQNCLNVPDISHNKHYTFKGIDKFGRRCTTGPHYITAFSASEHTHKLCMLLQNDVKNGTCARQQRRRRSKQICKSVLFNTTFYFSNNYIQYSDGYKYDERHRGRFNCTTQQQTVHANSLGELNRKFCFRLMDHQRNNDCASKRREKVYKKRKCLNKIGLLFY